MLIQGDCLKELSQIGANSVDLIYLDPPFFSQKTQKLTTKDGLKTYAFEDTWDNIQAYKNYIQERLQECRAVLKDTGSLFLHCDRSASHHLRLALDEVFGAEHFQSEIIRSYRRRSNAKKGLLNAHQVIFFYSKTADFKFNPTYTDYSPTTNLDQIFQKRARDAQGKTIYKTSETGETELMESKKGVPLSDLWEIPYLNPKAKERVGYPTQKPILLLERIIELVTDEGDMVLDPFCGSGTTLVAAKLLQRKYIGIDQSQAAIELSVQRLAHPIKSESELLKRGKGAYLNQDPQTGAILADRGIIPVQRNRGIDGFLKGKDHFKPIPVRIQKAEETLEQAVQCLTQACQRNGYQKKILITTNKHKNLFHHNCIDSEVIIVEDYNQFSLLKASL